MAKGGTTNTTQAIPQYLQDANKEAINDARAVSEIGYVPYFGPDVAAFSPMQQQSMLSTGNAASSFGLAPQGFDGTAGIPQAQTFAGGIQGYSSAPIYEQALDNLYAKAPAQYRAIKDRFIDPFTGARPNGQGFANAEQTSQMFSNGDNGRSPYGNDANMAHLNRMKEQGASDVYDSIYQQTYTAGDLVNGDTFVGNDGLNYTVGYDVGQVDPSLANAVQRNKINELRSNSSAIGSIVGNTLQGGPMSRLFEGITGVAPFNSNDAQRGSLSNADVRDGRFNGITGYDQPSQIQGGLLNNSQYQRELDSGSRFAQARQEEDIRLSQEAVKEVQDFQAFMAKQEAQIAQLNQLNAAAASSGNNKSTVNSGRNSAGNGFNASNPSGSLKSGQTDYGYF